MRGFRVLVSTSVWVEARDEEQAVAKAIEKALDDAEWEGEVIDKGSDSDASKQGR